MIQHLVLVRWRVDVALDEVVAALIAALRNYVEGLEGLLEYRLGPNLGIRPRTADFGIAALFRDESTLQVYADAPAHRAIVDTLIRPNAEWLTSIQFDVDSPRNQH